MEEAILKIQQNQTLILQKLDKLEEQQHEELMTSAEVRDFLKISRAKFDRLKEQGLIKVYKMGGSLLCKKSEIINSVNNSQLAAKA